MICPDGIGFALTFLSDGVFNGEPVLTSPKSASGASSEAMIPAASPNNTRWHDGRPQGPALAGVIACAFLLLMNTGCLAGAKHDDAYRPPAGTGSTLQVPGSPPPSAILQDSLGPAVERGELAPVMAADGSGLPYELWRGVDIAGFEKLISEIEIPPRSPALHDLWKRLVTSNVTPPAGQTADIKFTALRLEALYRSGLAAEAAAELAPPAGDPVLALFAARNALANADRDKACELSRQVAGLKPDTPKPVLAQAALLNGYCAAVGGDAAGAGLAAELAREAGLQQTPGLAALDAISIGIKPQTKIEGRLGLIDYRLLEAAGAPPSISGLDKAEPALLVALTNDGASLPELRLAAAEAAAKLNAISPDALAAIYSALAPAQTADALLSGAGGLSGPARRAALFKAAEAERTPMKKTRLIRALVDDARANMLAFPVMRMLARTTARVPVQPELFRVQPVVENWSPFCLSVPGPAIVAQKSGVEVHGAVAIFASPLPLLGSLAKTLHGLPISTGPRYSPTALRLST